MRQHPRWMDAAYWTAIAARCVVLAEREREREAAAARKRERIKADIERFWAKQGEEEQG